MSKWPARFRVYLPRQCGRGFWDVRIFKDATALRAFAASDDMPGGSRKKSGRTVGFCRAIHVSKHGGKWGPSRRRRGLVLLCFPWCGAGVVSHEWTHAAHYELAVHRRRNPLRLKDHERLAFLQGEFVRRFWCAFYRRFRVRGDKMVRFA